MQLKQKLLAISLLFALQMAVTSCADGTSPPPSAPTPSNIKTHAAAPKADTPTPADAVAAKAADDSYIIRPGDVLQVTVWKEEGMDREVIVLPDGTINFPLIGAVNLQEQTAEQAQAKIKERLSKYIPEASVSVVIKANLGHTVSVLGQVAKPGEFVMSHHMTVMQALSQAGGLTPYANEGRIKIIRQENGKEISIPFPYDDVANGDDLEKNIQLKAGDVVVVPTGGLF